jgi:hypothetical protein
MMIVSVGQRHTVDISTVGAQTGRLRRIEIWCHEVDGRWYLAGFSRRRHWYANVISESHLVVHSSDGDRVVEAVPVVDNAHRYAVFAAIAPNLTGPQERPRSVVVTHLMREGVLVELRETSPTSN